MSRYLDQFGREELAQHLRVISGDYFDGEDVATDCGICAALSDNIDGIAYFVMEDLMTELGFKGTVFEAYVHEREDWEPRAWMCLFLSEYLEETA